MRRLTLLCVVFALVGVPCLGEETFNDVPNDHWAKEAVDIVAQTGIMNGYPDGAFKGDKAVTRYELSVALAKMVEFIQASQRPLQTDECKKLEIKSSTHWAAESRRFLKCEGFLPKDSPVFSDGKKLVTCEELGEALALVSAKLIETSVPPTGAPD